MKYTYFLLLFFFSFFVVQCTNSKIDIRKGEKLLNNPELGYGTTGKTCTTCHENGEGISTNFDTKKKYKIMGLDIKTLPEAINSCIEIT